MSDDFVFDRQLAKVYGLCVVCGAHRVPHRIIETHLDGRTTDHTSLFCGRVGVHGADEIRHHGFVTTAANGQATGKTGTDALKPI